MAEQEKRSDGNPGPYEILIVDDDARSAELLEADLIAMEANIRIAVDGVDALEQVEAKKPDIILLDIMMPRMSGFEVCRRLKSESATRDIITIMVTALNEVGDIERGVDCGADEFLSKPINKLELLTRVKSLLSVRNLDSELERTLSYMEDIESEDDRG